MNRKSMLVLFFAYTIYFCIGVCIFVLLFHLPIFSSISVLFYRGIIFLCITACILFCIIIYANKLIRSIWTVRDTVLILVITCAVLLIFFTHVPVTAERSISIFLLGYMNTNQESITKQQIQEEFIQTYVMAYDAMEKRLQEQLATGTIRQDSAGGYHITSKGKLLMYLYEGVARLFRIDTHLILHQ